MAETAERTRPLKYLFDYLDTLEAGMAGKRLLLLLDFDGTLAPIAPTPDEAALPAETRRELVALVESSACSIGIISGRALGDVRAKVGIPGITYVGNHGIEVLRPNEEPRSVDMPHFRAMLERLKEDLAARLAPFPGAIIEDKGYSLAVHYRTVAEEDRSRVKAAVHETIGAAGGEQEIKLSTGAMVLELRPPIGCDKGTIVSSLLESEGAARGTGGAVSRSISATTQRTRTRSRRCGGRDGRSSSERRGFHMRNTISMIPATFEGYCISSRGDAERRRR